MRTKRRLPVGREWFNKVLMFPDFLAEPCLWVLDDDSDCLWSDAPLSAELAEQLDEWRETWTEHCFRKGCVWDSREVYDTWSERAVLLCALANRELVPLGFAVIWRPSHYPDEHGRRGVRMSFRRGRHNALRDLTAREFTRIIAQSNVVLSQHQEELIPAE
jgi:hypothetical protein